MSLVLAPLEHVVLPLIVCLPDVNFLFSFKKLAAAWKEEFDCRNSATELQSDLVLESGVPKYFRDDEISAVIKELLEPSVGLARSKAVQKYVLIGEHIYKEACQLDEKIHCFETCIRRPYFHVKPLDGNQLENWRDYLNFAEKQGDFDWVWLISCGSFMDLPVAFFSPFYAFNICNLFLFSSLTIGG